MTLEELKSLFLGYCRKENGAPDKQLFGLEYENFVMVPNNETVKNVSTRYLLKENPEFSGFWKI